MKDKQRNALRLVRIARGQLDNIIKDMEEGDTSVTVSNRILAAMTELKVANRELLCYLTEQKVLSAADLSELPQKLDEVTEYLDRIFKQM